MLLKKKFRTIAAATGIAFLVAAVVWLVVRHSPADSDDMRRAEVTVSGTTSLCVVSGGDTLTLISDTTRLRGVWMDRHWWAPSCKGRVLTLATAVNTTGRTSPLRHVARVAGADPTRLVSMCADSLVVLLKRKSVELDEMDYYLRSHGVIDEGYTSIAAYADRQRRETDSLVEVLGRLDGFKMTAGARLVWKGDYVARWMGADSTAHAARCFTATWSPDSVGKPIVLQTVDRRKPKGVFALRDTADWKGRHLIGVVAYDSVAYGTRFYAGGVYHGSFDGQMRASGYGCFLDTLGGYYEGQWTAGERDGFGFSTTKKRLRVGEWNNGRYSGERLSYNADRVYGIDISRHQHQKGRKRYSIDWDHLRITHLGSLSKKNISGKVDYPVSFIFIKSTEGVSVTNPYYVADYLAARRHGFHVGTYHFYSHLTPAARQAAHFLQKSRFAQSDLPPVLDLEPLPSQVRKMGGTAAMWAGVRTWLRIVERRTGRRPILYVNQQFVNRYLDAAPDIKHGYQVWIARYGEYKPDLRLCIWQLAPDGRVRGIHGEVDINVFNGYRTEFERWTKGLSE